MSRIPYAPLCAVLGLLLGWWPALLHGPIPEKFNILYIQGAVVVWGWYIARSLIGLLVGITHWPRQWWLRGPLCGLFMLFPLGFVSLGTPGCGAPCMMYNQLTAITIGTAVAGLAYWITGRSYGES